MKPVHEIIDETIREGMQAQEKMLINDIIDIYNGEYKNYSSYLKEKQLFNERIEEQANNIGKQSKEITTVICVKALLIAEPMFTYIKNKGDVENAKSKNK